MCTMIDADCVLANLLQKHEHVTVQDLNRVRVAIEQKISDIYVDVTINCLVWAVNQRPEMFSFENNSIRRMKLWSQDYVDELFNRQIPSEIRSRVLDALKLEIA
jgi:hypothetical protein